MRSIAMKLAGLSVILGAVLGSISSADAGCLFRPCRYFDGTFVYSPINSLRGYWRFPVREFSEGYFRTEYYAPDEYEPVVHSDGRYHRPPTQYVR